MKRAIVVVVLLGAFALSGCALIDYYKACKADEACMASAEGKQAATETIVSTGVSLIPHPVAQAGSKMVGKGAGYIALILSLLLGGRTLLKKEPKE